MKPLILYLHGQGGSAAEAERYRPLFPDADVLGLAYAARTPWEARRELLGLYDAACAARASVRLIANSIGAFYAMNALSDKRIERAYFISPIVDMEQLILGMMARAGVSEDELRAKGEIETASGETLSWAYLRDAREHPLRWTVPTRILCGARDALTAPETVAAFAEKLDATLTVMPDGEHWFHTAEQLRFLDDWLRRGVKQDDR